MAGHEGYLSVPPPAQQRSVGDPGVHVILAEEVQVGTDHVLLRVGPLFVGHDAFEVAFVIMAERATASGGL